LQLDCTTAILFLSSDTQQIRGQCKNSEGNSHVAVFYTLLTVIDIKEDKWLAYLARPYLTQITDQSVWPFDPDTYTVGIGSSARIP